MVEPIDGVARVIYFSIFNLGDYRSVVDALLLVVEVHDIARLDAQAGQLGGQIGKADVDGSLSRGRRPLVHVDDLLAREPVGRVAEVLELVRGERP